MPTSYALAAGLDVDETSTRRRPLGETSSTPPDEGSAADALAGADPARLAKLTAAGFRVLDDETIAPLVQFTPEDGYLLDLATRDPKKCARRLLKEWKRQDDHWSYARARWSAADKRRKGYTGVQILKGDTDRNVYRVYVPPGADKAPPTFNKPARLCRRLVSNLMVDPPVPECVPGVGATNEDPDASEFATRIGQDLAGPMVLNVTKLMRRALSSACTYDSGFLWVTTDPRGGGHRPKSILASTEAQHEDEAVIGMRPVPVTQPDPVTGAPVPVIDPATGQPATEMQEVQLPGPYVTRYVREDGTLTDAPKEAALEWLPKLRARQIRSPNVRPWPVTAPSVDEAEGVLIYLPQSLGRLRKEFPIVREMSPAQIRALAGFRPDDARELFTPGTKDVRADAGDEAKDSDEPVPDNVIVMTLCMYVEGGTPSYPYGAYLCMAGEDTLLHAQKWSATIGDVEKPLLVPVAQFKQWDEGEDDFYGIGTMHLLGSGGEVRASTIGTAIDHLYRFNFRKTFYTPDALYTPKQAQAMGAYVPIAAGTEPKPEEVPDYPEIGKFLMELSSSELDDEVGLAPVAQGISEPEVKSGLHAQRLIEQVNVGLADIKQNVEDGFLRLMRVALQQVQAFYTVPQMVRVVGDDNEYKQKEFMGSDLAADVDVRILRGTMTMLAPSAKMAIAEHGQALGIIDVEQLRRIFGGNLGGTLGVQDYPPLLRVRGQIARWMDGPPKDGDPTVFAGAAASVFARSPNDVEPPLPGSTTPGIALLRMRELSLAMASTKFARQPPEWQQVLVTEYLMMRGAAGIQPLVQDSGLPFAPQPIDPATGQPIAAPAPDPSAAGAPGGQPAPPMEPATPPAQPMAA